MSDAADGTAAITCEGRLESLGPLLDFVDRAAADAGVEPDTAFAIRLAAEEVCTNVITHGYAGGAPGPVTLRLRRDGGALELVIEDRAPLFDPTVLPRPDLSGDWESRPPGGVGWHLVREIMDEVQHVPRSGGGNVVTLVKRLPGTAGRATSRGESWT